MLLSTFIFFSIYVTISLDVIRASDFWCHLSLLFICLFLFRWFVYWLEWMINSITITMRLICVFESSSICFMKLYVPVLGGYTFENVNVFLLNISFYAYIMCLRVCLHTTCIQASLDVRRGITSLELVVSYHVGSGEQTWVFCNSIKCSSLLSPYNILLMEYFS